MQSSNVSLTDFVSYGNLAEQQCMRGILRRADSPDFKPRVNWSRFHETMPLADMAKDPYAMSPTALKTNVTSLTSTDGVNGPADISGAVPSPLSVIP